MKKIRIALIGLLFTGSMYAQDYNDVLQFSESFYEGNARFMGMAGAYGSLGANVSALSINPAGSALFRGGVFEFSPTFSLTKSENHYLGNYDRAFTSTMKIPNLGLVVAKNVKQNDLFITGVAYGFSVNRQNNYNQTLLYSGKNSNNSLTDEFVRLANQNLFYADFTQLADNAYLIGYDTTHFRYFSDFRWYDDGAEIVEYGQDQSIGIRRGGAKKEFLANFAVDFSQKVFVGADLSIESLYYTENIDITETDNAGTKPFLNSYTYSTQRVTSGAGVGGKLGVIIKPIEYLRFGFAVHSPVVYAISEETTSTIDAYFDKPIVGDMQRSATNINNFDYSVGKPAKFITSLGFVYKNMAVIGVDYEIVDYTYAYISSKTTSMSAQNKAIMENLTQTSNLKVGAELKYGPFGFRGGLASYGNPYKFDNSTYRTDVTGGIGLSNDNFYCDFAWVKSFMTQTNTLYSDYYNKAVDANSKVKLDNIVLTVGLKF